MSSSAEYLELKPAPATFSVDFSKLNDEAIRRAKECDSAKMPNMDHLRMRDYDHVYEPSDDTYLLIDAIGFDIDSDSSLLAARTNTSLEIGCGTGTPGVYLMMRLIGSFPSSSIAHYATDINEAAIKVAKSTALHNALPEGQFKAVKCDLASDLLVELEGKVDVLIFNPPYVPTPNDEVGSSGIEASWAGGTSGRVVIDRALPQIAQLLSRPNGVAYVVVVDDNNPEEIAHIMEDRHGIRVVPWLRRKARNEYLTILKMTTTAPAEQRPK